MSERKLSFSPFYNVDLTLQRIPSFSHFSPLSRETSTQISGDMLLLPFYDNYP